MLRDPSREIVITGAGAVCNLGDDLDAMCDVMRGGTPVSFDRFEPAIEYQCRCQLMGCYRGDVSDDALGITKAKSRFMGRASRLALRAAQSALDASGLQRRDIAVIVASGAGDVQTHIDMQARLDRSHDAKRTLPTVIPRLMASTVSANLVNVLQTTGPSFTASAACSGGAYNMLLAAELIERGHCEAALAGGAEVMDLHFYAGFDSMRAYNGQDNDDPIRASRPYAADRAGFIFGEGAGIVVLETRAHAQSRGAPILARLLGYGMSSDGDGQMVSPSSVGAHAAMQAALKHAGIEVGAVDYVNTHGTSTPLGDIAEVRAIAELFGERRVPYSSTKGYTGHTVSAAGALEAIFTARMIRGGWLAPSVNASPLDPELEDRPPVLSPTDASPKIALSNSFGFGGTNVSLALA